MDLGEQELKGFGQGHRLFRVLTGPPDNRALSYRRGRMAERFPSSGEIIAEGRT